MNVIEPSECAIFAELEGLEITFARDQPQYRKLRAITDHTRVLTRWTPSPEQRALIAAGEDIFLECLTFGSKLQPVRLSIGLTVEEAKKLLKLADE